jgi:hypothetical protein|tara:strand:+ start:100 stop:306 length:207 start_codon:yes stop_codon:yes gene_type:complete
MAKGNQMGGNSRVTSQKFQKRVTQTGRICNKCNEDKLESEYGANKSWCLSCVRAYQKKLRDKKRAKLW